MKNVSEKLDWVIITNEKGNIKWLQLCEWSMFLLSLMAFVSIIELEVACFCILETRL